MHTCSLLFSSGAGVRVQPTVTAVLYRFTRRITRYHLAVTVPFEQRGESFLYSLRGETARRDSAERQRGETAQRDSARIDRARWWEPNE